MVERPDSSPVLIVVLKGWIDAGLGADGAAEVLTEQLDRQHRGPLRRRRAARLAGPPAHHAPRRRREHAAHLGRDRAALGEGRHGHDVLLLFGDEPDHAWLAFTEQVVDLADDLGVRMVVGSAPIRRPCRTPARRCWPLGVERRPGAGPSCGTRSRCRRGCRG